MIQPPPPPIVTEIRRKGRNGPIVVLASSLAVAVAMLIFAIAWALSEQSAREEDRGKHKADMAAAQSKIAAAKQESNRQIEQLKKAHETKLAEIAVLVEGERGTWEKRVALYQERVDELIAANVQANEVRTLEATVARLRPSEKTELRRLADMYAEGTISHTRFLRMQELTGYDPSIERALRDSPEKRRRIAAIIKELAPPPIGAPQPTLDEFEREQEELRERSTNLSPSN